VALHTRAWPTSHERALSSEVAGCSGRFPQPAHPCRV